MMQASAATLAHAANLGAPPTPANDQDELIVDLFAGGGGASTAILNATGRHPDIAINHDPEAIALHQANHPPTRHYCSDINEVDPKRAVAEFKGAGGLPRPVGLLWASPDCKHHSKARGGKPREKNIRSLAWIVVRWAAQVRPRVIALENVEEFQDWGPLLEVDTLINEAEIGSLASQADRVDANGQQLALFDAPAEPAPKKAVYREYKAGQPDPRHLGVTFRRWVGHLEKYGYRVEWRELVAADYGAPTTRKRLFLIARCDGRPIIWPERTHAPRDKAGILGLQPWLPAASIIDWSLKVPSIFGRKKSLEPKTHARIAKGIKRYVVEAARPFIVPITHSGPGRVHDSEDPLRTICAGPKRGEFSLVSPYLTAQYGERDGQEPRTRDVDVSPYPTAVPGGNGGKLVHAVLGGAIVGCGGRAGQSPPRGLDDPLGTATAKADKCVTTATLAPFVVGTNNTSTRAMRAFSPEEPIRTVTAAGGFAGAGVFMTRQFGASNAISSEEPVPTVMAGGAGKTQVAAAFMTRQFGTASALPVDEPAATVMADGGGGKTQAVTVYMDQQNGSRIGRAVDDPLTTITHRATQQHVAAITIDKYYATGTAAEASEPLDTATTKSRFSINATYLEQANTGMVGHDARDPLSTIVGKGCTQRVVDCALEGFGEDDTGRRGDVLAFLWEHFGEPTAAERESPLGTARGRLRFGLVVIDDVVYRIVDIGMRMLEPKELYGAQGFPADYKIAITVEGVVRGKVVRKILTKTAQTRMAGNSVSPPPATALLAANLPEWQQRRMAA